MTIRKWMPVALVAGAVCLAGCKPKTDTEPPVAIVNGKPVSAAAFTVWVQAQTNHKVEELAPDQKAQLLKGIEKLYLSAEEAEKQKVGEDPQVAARLELDHMNLLATTLFQNYVKSKTTTDADLHAEYDRQVAQMAKSEYHAHHILVKDEALAKDIIAKLAKGAKFEQLATQYSLDKGNGGELPWFTADRMVKPFSEAVTKMKPGETTQVPVQTEYGFHVIRLDETRPVEPPSFDSIKDRLGPMIQQNQVHDYIDTLTKAAKIQEGPLPPPGLWARIKSALHIG